MDSITGKQKGQGQSPQVFNHLDMRIVQAMLLAKGCLDSGERPGPELFTCDSEGCCYAFCAGCVHPRAPRLGPSTSARSASSSLPSSGGCVP